MRLSVILIVLLTAFPAAAQDARAVKRVEDLNRAAMEDYDLLELESARKQLSDALAIIKRSRLERDPVAARTHMNLGIVHGAGLGDQDTALLEFIAALEIDPEAKIDPSYRSPALQKTFDQARTSVAGKRGGGSGSDPGPSVPAAPTSGLVHAVVEEANAGLPISVEVRVQPQLADRISQVVLRYRPAGAEAFTPAPMAAAGGGVYEGQIPDNATQGETVHYFIEARAVTGKVMATAGTVDSPHIVSIVRSMRRPDEDPIDSENPLDRGRDPVGSGTGGGDDDEPTSVRRGVEVGKKTFFVTVTAGAGGAYITGETEVSHQAVTCCVAIAPFHVMPEVGFWLGRSFTVSLLGRLGFPLGANVTGKATLAPAVLARATYFLGRRGGLYLHGDLGGGFIRHTVKLSRSSATAAMGDTDTFATGPLLAGGGAGYILPLAGPLRFVVDLNILVGIPVINQIGSGARATKPGFAVNGDLSLGVSFAF